MTVRIITGDCRLVLPTLPADSFDCVVTSPPYHGLRSYLPDGHPNKAAEIGLEPTLAEYLDVMVGVFREVRRVMKPSGTAWLNVGDGFSSSTKGTGGGGAASGLMRDGRAESGRQSKYDAVARQQHAPIKIATGLKPKDLMMVPNRLAILLQDDGWWIRSEIIWHKPSPMPESVTDRPTCAHEKVWLLTRSERYFYDAGAIAEPANAFQRQGTSGIPSPKQMLVREMGGQGMNPATYAASYEHETRNARNVWSIANSEPYRGAHYAVMPSALAERCIKAGSPVGGSVLDPFFGAGTTGLVADRLGRHCTGIELNPANRELGAERVRMDGPLFAEVSA